MARILLIDDDDGLREVLAYTLREQGHEVETAADGTAGLVLLERAVPDAVITDLKMPGIDGLEVLRRAHEIDATLPVIVLTAFGSIEDAVAAMRDGAHDYLTKPYNRDELRLTVEKALEKRRLVQENRTLRDRLREERRRMPLVHASPAMERVVAAIRRLAPTDATVLVTGESGTGKELVAQSLHNLSDRWDGPFVAINCAAIPHDLMESELFGHERGAFTGAVREKPGKFRQAHGGTLLLDEVADLAADLQTKLLRVIETRLVDPVGGTRPVPVDVRIVAATNADLGLRVAEGRFREDLYYRLNVIPIHLLPLRERLDDIPALWEQFVERFAPGVKIRTSPELVRALMRRPWPGNARELANLCQRLVLLRVSDEMTEEDLRTVEEGSPARSSAGDAGTESRGKVRVTTGAEGARGDGGGGGAADDSGFQTADWAPGTGKPDQPSEPDMPDKPGILYPGALPVERLSLPDLERELIIRALDKHGGNKSRAATYLGVPRHVLLYRMEKFGIG
jgi:two-component system NtrC family response regulator